MYTITILLSTRDLFIFEVKGKQRTTRKYFNAFVAHLQILLVRLLTRLLQTQELHEISMADEYVPCYDCGIT